MHTNETLTVNTGGAATVYTTPFSSRARTQWSVQLDWAGASITSVITIWVSNVEAPGLANDNDWVQVTDVTITGPTTSNAGKLFATVGNAAGKWYRLKIVTSNGSGTFTSRVHSIIPRT